MTTFLFDLIIKPIYVILEMLFYYIYNNSYNLGLTVFLISAFVSIASLPLYLSADKLQDEEKEIQRKLKPKVDEIKKSFRGDERQFILNTYYKQNNYNPIMGLRSSLSLLLQIPFFIAAYTFFNNLSLVGLSPNTSAFFSPDGLISLFGIHLNLFPILMTIVNLCANYVYSKDKSLKSNWGLMVTSLIFLVLLYNSPMILTLYWLYNNVFSLAKNICLKYMTREKLIKYSFILVFVVSYIMQISFSRKTFLFLFIFIFILIMHTKKVKEFFDEFCLFKHIFILSVVGLFLLIGNYVPLCVMSNSPLEFIYRDGNAFTLLFHNLTIYAGILLFWFVWLFYFCNIKGRKIISFFMLYALAYSVVDLLLIKMPISTLNSDFAFENGFVKFNIFVGSQYLYYLVLFIVSIIISLLIYLKREKTIRNALLLIIATIIVLSIPKYYNISTINYNFEKEKKSLVSDYKTKYINLSKTGKNVIIIFIDRFINSYIPISFEEKPELYNQFSGFTYYPNTLSFYGHTILAYPPILGGYEYIPYEMDKRKELFDEKFEQALTLLPAIFSQNNWSSSVINPMDKSWMKYAKWGSISFSDAKKISNNPYYKKYNISNEEIYTPDSLEINGKTITKIASMPWNNIVFYSLIPVVPPYLRVRIYGNIKYNSRSYDYAEFLKNYMELLKLSEFTDFNSGKNSFVVFNNNLTHESRVLNYPNYDLSGKNDETYQSKFKQDDEVSVAHYHTGMASLMLLGRYFDFLKENGVYDNTRIIIVSDHGHFIQNANFSGFLNDNFLYFNPTLMVKDFDEQGKLKIDNSLMTNADVPTIATKDIIKNPINVYTGKIITDSEKYKGVLIKTDHYKWQPKYYMGRTKILEKGDSFSFVKGIPTDEKNWKTNLNLDDALRLMKNH